MEMYYGSVPWVNGVVAGINCHDYLSDPKGRIPVPQALRDLLSRCMETDREKRPQDFSLIEKELLTIYRNVTGIVYFRPEPKAAADTADSLNNRALSFLDLDMPQKAVEFWESALKKDPGNAQVIFNRALYCFRSGQATINQAEDMLSSIQDTDIRAECIEALRNEKGELRLKMRWMDCRVLDVSEDGRFACGLEWDAYNMRYHPDIPNSNQLYLMPKADAEKDILTEEDGKAAEIWEDDLNTETPDMVDSGTGSNCMSLSGNGRFLAVTQAGEDDDEDDEEYDEEAMSTSVWEIPQPDTLEGYFQEIDFDEDNLVRVFPFGGGILNRDGSMIAFQLMNEDSEIDGIQICETKSGKKLKRLSSDLYFLDFTPQGNLAALNVEEDELSIITPTGKICPGTKKMKGLKEAFWSFRRNAMLTEAGCVYFQKNNVITGIRSPVNFCTLFRGRKENRLKQFLWTTTVSSSFSGSKRPAKEGKIIIPFLMLICIHGIPEMENPAKTLNIFISRRFGIFQPGTLLPVKRWISRESVSERMWKVFSGS